MAAVKDRDRPLQALSLKRIIKAVEDHWSEPAVLAGVLHELRFRLEPDAAFQARSIARRLSTLHYQLSHDAARVAEETRAAADAIAILPAAADEEADEDEAKPRSRRRWLALGAFGAAAAIAVTAWLLRPEAKALEASDLAGPGSAVSASGRVAQLQDPTATARPSRSFDREPPRRVAINDQPLPARTNPGPRSVRDRGGVADTPASGPAHAPDEARAGASLRSPMLREELAAAASERPAPAPIERLRTEVSSAASGTAPAEAGVEVTDAAIDCYVSDRTPENCGASVTPASASRANTAQDGGKTAGAGAVEPVDAAAPG
ncbi:MAG: hypothetical protein JO128_16860, partial [Alphaproteobacteria bacterium]|nr:hypothetical protein [Alphaproteobacteria bacterium]